MLHIVTPIACFAAKAVEENQSPLDFWRLDIYD
jgi:hypothetical protein